MLFRSASFTVASMDMQFGMDVATHSFFSVFPRSILIGGLPSLVLVMIILSFWKSENNIKLIVILIVSILVGILCGPVLYISFGV